MSKIEFNFDKDVSADDRNTIKSIFELSKNGYQDAMVKAGRATDHRVAVTAKFAGDTLTVDCQKLDWHCH